MSGLAVNASETIIVTGEIIKLNSDIVEVNNTTTDPVKENNISQAVNNPALSANNTTLSANVLNVRSLRKLREKKGSEPRAYGVTSINMIRVLMGSKFTEANEDPNVDLSNSMTRLDIIPSGLDLFFGIEIAHPELLNKMELYLAGRLIKSIEGKIPAKFNVSDWFLGNVCYFVNSITTAYIKFYGDFSRLLVFLVGGICNEPERRSIYNKKQTFIFEEDHRLQATNKFTIHINTKMPPVSLKVGFVSPDLQVDGKDHLIGSEYIKQVHGARIMANGVELTAILPSELIKSNDALEFYFPDIIVNTAQRVSIEVDLLGMPDDVLLNLELNVCNELIYTGQNTNMYSTKYEAEFY